MDNLIQYGYVVSAALFIFRVQKLGSPATARRGNTISSIGMLLAVVLALLDQGIVEYQFIAIGVVVGAVIGGAAARLVQMTSMPEMVALFNGFGGMASLLVGSIPTVLIGSLLAGKIPGRAIQIALATVLVAAGIKVLV